MTPERHSQIGEIYHAVLEVAPEERAALLKHYQEGEDSSWNDNFCYDVVVVCGLC